MTYLHYSASVETIDPDEDETFRKIIDVMAGGGRITRERYGQSVRTSHAKTHGLLKGELRVLDGLPPELRQGLFAEPKAYPVIVRLAHVPGELLDDRRVSTPRGMAIKVLGVEGPKLPAHQGQVTHDFVLDTGKVFNAPTAKVFLGAITATEVATPMPEGVKGAVSMASRATNAVLNAVGLNSANLDFYGHPFNHPLTESYFTQCAVRYGDYVAKIGFFPVTYAGDALVQPFEPKDENGLRTTVVEAFRVRGTEFEVRVQLCTDLDRMPVENASTEWPEDESPYLPVARLTLPPQDAFTAARQSFVDEDLLFCPAHALAAHRPLGSIMRARMKAYEALGTARIRENGRTRREPRSIEEMPA
ncbi:catalase family protein [uncultured Enterovirga sp.]|uniref:catalase family protein n=1 Tax=uncultured Enterovirga sp. TaxID=2026352 RepID=UPI0035C9DA59